MPHRHEVCHHTWKARPQWDTESQAAKAIRDPRVIKLFWNAKYDIHMLKKAGIEVKGPIIDVMLLGRIIHTAERRGCYTLKHFTRKFLPHTYQEEIKLKKWITAAKRRKEPHAYGDAPLVTLAPYALLDAQATFELFYLMKGELTPPLAKLLAREHKVLAATIRMENRGWLTDEKLILSLMAECTEGMKIAKDSLRKSTNDPLFNPNSPKQLARVFFQEARRNPIKVTDAGQASTDKVAMLMLRDKFEDSRAQTVLDWRKVSKARSTYLQKFLDLRDAEGILRCSFNQSGTRTGRYSSSDPNLQNITRPDPNSPAGRLRECFIAREDYRFICIDYNQVELRLGAHFAQVQAMLTAIDHGIDLHGDTCKRMFHIDERHPDWKLKRQVAKTLNFAIFYGIGSEEFVDTLIRESELYLSLYEAAGFRKIYKEIYPEIETYFDTIKAEVLETGGVTNPYGRFMEVSRFKAYVGVNYTIQSTAADLIKERMIICDDMLRGRKSGLVATVHDELIFEMHHSERHLIPQLKRTMEELDQFSVPLTCSVAIAKRWGQKKELIVA